MKAEELIERIRGVIQARGRDWMFDTSNGPVGAEDLANFLEGTLHPPERPLRRVMRAIQFTRLCKEGLDIFIDRNRIYEDAFTQIGLLGICAELIGCVNRLKPLVLRRSENLPPWQTPEQKELIRNTLVDTHNFSNIALMMLEEENWAGKG